MSYINRKFSWDFDSFKRFYEKYIKGSASNPDTIAGLDKKLQDEATARATYISNEAAARIAADNAEATERANADTALGNRMTTLEGSVDDRLDQQDATIKLLGGHKVEVVDVLPTDASPAITPESDVIYRLVITDAETGDVSYEDYMYNEDDLTTPRKIADYSFPGVDEEPTAGSKNLVESGGIAEAYGEYKDNDEWVYTLTDKDSKFIFGIRKDGSIEWSVGVPTPIQKLVNSIVIGTDGVNLDGLNKIEAFLDEFSTEDSLKALLDAKVDKEESKGLIPLQYIDEVDNPEFVKIILDGEGHILAGIRSDGEILFGIGIPGQIRRYVEENLTNIEERVGYYKDNPEFISIRTDAEDRIIEGTSNDGTKILPAGIDVDSAIVKSESNSEYLEVTVDSDGRVINSIDAELEDIRYGGINLSEIKRDADVATIEVSLDEINGDIYTIENFDSSMTLEMDDDWNLYVIKDSRQEAEIVMDEEGNLYIEQTLIEI